MRPSHSHLKTHTSVETSPSPHPVTKLCVRPFIDLLPEFLSVEGCSSLIRYLTSSACSNSFNNEGERSVLYFGEHGYDYSGKTHQAQKPPDIIEGIISTINEQFPDKPVNSCLVTRYLNGLQHCPSHQDDEDVIAPESDIYTLSVGAERVMSFQDRRDPEACAEDLTLPHRSLLIFSRLSQEAYKHAIPLAAHINGVRFSLTFRSIAPFFANSTIILGDSNTEHLTFGSSSRGSFGQWMPGKRVECIKVENIPPPEKVGPYKNILIHVGINDIKFKNPAILPDVVSRLELKCRALADALPSSRIYICPILPTKDGNKIPKVFRMNQGIVNFVEKHKRFMLMDNYFDLFADRRGIMDVMLGRFKQGKPLDEDDLHLGSSGIRLLAQCMKHCVLRRKGPITQYSVRDNNKGSSNTNIIGIRPNVPSPFNGQYGRTSITNNPGVSNRSFGHY